MTTRTRKVWYFTGRGNDYPLGFFSSQKKVRAEIHRITVNNPQRAVARYDVKSSEVR